MNYKNYRLEQLLAERKEINKQIKKLRKGKEKEAYTITLGQIKAGNVFGWNFGPTVLLETGKDSGRFILGGNHSDSPFDLFSDFPRTKQEILELFDYHRVKFLGTLTTNFVEFRKK